MAGPGIRITGQGPAPGGLPLGGSPNDLLALFHKMISHPSVQNERLFSERYLAQNPGSIMFGSGGGGARGGVPELRSAAAALSHSAGALGRAAAQLSAAAQVQRGAAVAGGSGGEGRGGGLSGFGSLGGGLGGPVLRHLGGQLMGKFLKNPMMGGALGLVGAALAGFVEATMIPMQISHIQDSLLGKSEKWIKLSRSTSRLGIGGGFNFRGLRAGLTPGMTAEPGFMAMLGLSPQDVADELGRFGIPQHSAAQAMNTARLLEQYAHTKAFSMIGLQGTTQAAREMQTLGIPVERALAKLSAPLEKSGDQNVDQTRTLHAIQSILSGMASAGAAGISLGGTTSFFTRMSNSGFAGARTGQLQESVAAGLGQTLGNLAAHPVAMSALSMVLPLSTIRSPKALAKLLGEDRYKTLMKSPGTAHLLMAAEHAAQRGNGALAYEFLGPIIQGNPELSRKFFVEAANRIAPNSGIAMLAFADIAHTSLGGAAAAMYGNGAPGSPVSPGQVAGRAVLSRFDSSFNPLVDYTGPLLRAKVPKKYIDTVIAAARAINMNPVLLAARWHHEHSDFGLGMTSTSTGALGAMGVTGGPVNLYDSLVKGGKIFKHWLKVEKGDVPAAAADYVLGPNANFVSRILFERQAGNEMLSFFDKAGVGTNGLPTKENVFSGNTYQQELTASQTVFENLAVHAAAVDEVIHAFGHAIDQVTNKISTEFDSAIDSAGKALLHLMTPSKTLR